MIRNNAQTTKREVESVDLGAVDPMIRYPSYKSFDEFIDVERLRSLDSYIRERIKRRILENDDPKFYTGPYTVREENAGRPGSRMIYLAESSEPDSYFDLNKTELWHRSEAANEFALLMDFIATLPFEATGRILIMYDDQPRDVPAHRDHTETEVLHDFIWFRTNLSKPFYMLDHTTGERKYVEGHTAWFDSVNQFHGCDGGEGLTFSIRVDGRFTDEFRWQIAFDGANPASSPAVWAAQFGGRA